MSRFRIDEKTKQKIRDLAAQGVSQKALSERFGMGQGCISRIIRAVQRP